MLLVHVIFIMKECKLCEAWISDTLKNIPLFSFEESIPFLLLG